MLSFDDVLLELGEFGRYQIINYLIAAVPSIFLAFQVMQSVFMLGLPDYRCSLDDWGNDSYAIQDASHELKINASYPSKCFTYDSGMNKSISCSSWVYEETYYLPSAVMEFNMVCGRMMYRPTSNTAFMSGMLVGSVLGGELSDRIGRRKTLLMSLFLQAAAGIATGLAPEVYSFIAFRFLTAVGVTATMLTAVVISTEVVGPSKRQVTGFCSSFFWAAGVVFLTPFAYFIRNWRHLCIATSSLSAVFISYLWILPESPRWFLAKGRKREAEAIISDIERVNKKKLPEGFVEKLGDEQPAATEGSLQLVKNRTCLRRLVIIAFNWVAISTGYYGVSLNSGSLSGDLYVNYLVTCLVEVPAYFFALFAPYKFGRKIPHVFCLILGGAACFATLFVVIFGREDHQWVLTLLSTVGKFGIAAAFSSVYIYTIELFPTTLRNRSVGVCSMCARIGNMIAPFLSDLGGLIGARYSSALPLIVFGAGSITAGILSLLLPETYEKPLPETIAEAAALGMKTTISASNENGTEAGEGLPLTEVTEDPLPVA